MQTQRLAGHLPIACQILCQGLGSVTLPVSGGGVGREWLKAEVFFQSQIRPCELGQNFSGHLVPQAASSSLVGS